MRRLMLLLWVLVTAVTWVGAASAQPLKWSSPMLIENQPPFGVSDSVDLVSCPTARFCLAAERHIAPYLGGVEVSQAPADGISAWRYESLDGAGAFGTPEALSCASVHLCVELVSTPSGMVTVSSTSPSRGSGHWVADGAPRLASLACPTRGLCVGYPCGEDCVGYPEWVARRQGIWVTTKPRAGRAAWRLTSFANRHEAVVAITCRGARVCVAVANEGGHDVVLSTRNPTGGRRAWRQATLPLSSPTAPSDTGVACASADLCMVSDENGEVYTSTDPVARRPRWTRTTVADAGASVSCPTTRFCLTSSLRGIATSTDPTHGRSAWINSAWPTWQNRTPPISCASSHLCIAANFGGDFLASSRTPATGTRSFTSTQFGRGATAILGVGCASPDLCLAFGDDERLLRSNDPTGGASAWTLPGTATSTDVAAAGLTCLSANLCASISADGHLWTGDPTQPPTAWTEGPAATSVPSCSPDGLCAALDDAGVLTTHAPAGANWATTELPTPLECSDHMCSPTGLGSVSCPTASFCATTDAAAQLWTTSDPGGPASAWTESPVPKVSSDGGPRVICPNAHRCLLVTPRRVSITTDPTDKRPHWTSTPLPAHAPSLGADAISGLTCVSAQLCIAVDNQGWVLSGDPQSTAPWSETRLGITSLSLACTGGLCIAADWSGRMYTTHTS